MGYILYIVEAITLTVLLYALQIMTARGIASKRNSVLATVKEEFYLIQDDKTNELIPTLLHNRLTQKSTKSVLKESMQKKEWDYQSSRFNKEMKLRRDAFLKEYSAYQGIPLTDHKPTDRFVIFLTPFAGLGNLMHIMSEALCLSFITGRYFYMHGWNSFPLYYNLSFPNYYYPNSSFPKGDTYIQTSVIMKDYMSLLSSQKKFIVLRSISGSHLLRAICNDTRYYAFFEKNGFLMYNNSMIDVVKSMHSFIYNDIIRLNPMIQSRIDQVKRDMEWSSYYWIGLQIRSALTKRNIQAAFLENEDKRVFEYYAKMKTMEMEKLNQTVKWLIISDERIIRTLLLDMYPNYAVEHQCLISHSQDEISHLSVSESMICSLVENYLLSSVNYAVITGRSTFGRLALNRNTSVKSTTVNLRDYKKMKAQVLNLLG